MQELTRRRDRALGANHWHIFYGDVHVGTIGKRAGVPGTVDQRGWTCGLYPASNRGAKDAGTAADFDTARQAFERAWQSILPRCTGEDFVSYRRQRAWNNWKRKMWATGGRMPTQSADGRSICYCGEAIDLAGVDRHVYAAHLAEPNQDVL